MPSVLLAVYIPTSVNKGKNIQRVRTYIPSLHARIIYVHALLDMVVRGCRVSPGLLLR